MKLGIGKSELSVGMPSPASPLLVGMAASPSPIKNKIGDTRDGVPTRRAERGVALVITLILLSVITFMAIAFLVLSTNQRSAVNQMTEQNNANNAAQIAAARATAETMSWVLVTTNPFSPLYRVSTNYSSYYFTNGVSSPLNVNYQVNNAGAPLTIDQQRQNLTNLLLNPRPPVFITNIANGSNEFRYYLDLNRNGRFEPTGWLVVTDSFNNPITIGGIPVVNYFVGDPQWIGVLEFPDRPHGADNPFISRYAFIVLPASQSLDINYIHNYAKGPDPATMQVTRGDGFLRDQGAGTYEINLAAFLADLNGNIWCNNISPYGYNCGPANYLTPNFGAAFEDALGLLRYRYAGTTGTLASVTGLFGPAGAGAFRTNYIDDFARGPIMRGTWWPADNDVNPVNQNYGWPGANNINHFFTSQDLFDPSKVAPTFAANLQRAGTNNLSSYDRYTFYRLLSQLGTDTDSASDLGKINPNYDNLVRTNAQGIASATNFYAWDPTTFFTNTAIALLANAGYSTGLGLTNLLRVDAAGRTNLNIEVWPLNYYTPSIHHLLQLTANIYDSTTNRGATYPYFPTVFRPIFRRTNATGTNVAVFITGYVEVLNTGILASGSGSQDLEIDADPRMAASIPVLPTPFDPTNPRLEPLVSGFPLIVGVKKGFPNFNEFSMQTYANISRLLEFRRDSIDGPVKHTNQMYVANITNVFGLEAWNAYASSYPRPLQMLVVANMTAILTNEFGNVLVSNRVTQARPPININPNTWVGWTNPSTVQYSFNLPWGTNANFEFLTNHTYNSSTRQFEPLTHIFNPATRDIFDIPHWWLNLNTRLRYILIDTSVSPNRIVDYVDLNNWQPTIDLAATLAPPGTDCSGNPNTFNNQSVLFCTNRMHGAPSTATTIPPMGVVNQVNLCLWMNPGVTLTSFSTDPYAGLDSESAVDGFRFNLAGMGPVFAKDAGKTFYKSNVFYAPLTPFLPIYVHTTFQANDPLVHYTVGDLTDLSIPQTNTVSFQSQSPPLPNLGQPNTRYEPWGGNPFGARSNPTMPPYQEAAKDRFVTRPDLWEFPTNKYANVGWLGRVHRGTPWQTVYLKSPNILLQSSNINQNFAAWQDWSGNQQWVTNFGQISTAIAPIYSFTNWLASRVPDAVFSLPTNDWRILDLFSTAVNENAARGRLSINQTNLAAWSAVLSGVNVLNDLTNDTFIWPAGTNLAPNPLVTIVNGIINTRTNFPNNCYQRLGDILAVPQLTVASPYLTGNTNLMNDEVVERIPQQILGLLKGSEQPRFVIYSFGQSLKPAPQSIIPGGPYIGVCTNYQVTAEVATRTVVRIDGAKPVPGQPYNPHAVIENFNVLPPD